jgi:hypothetical protein
MHHYIVLDTADDGTLALKDDRQHYHVARMHSERHAEFPPSGESLQGNAPGLGFSLLLCVATGRVYRLTFEHIDCSQERTMALIHPQTTSPAFFMAEKPSAMGQAARRPDPTMASIPGARLLAATTGG